MFCFKPKNVILIGVLEEYNEKSKHISVRFIVASCRYEEGTP